jgi:excisionase family DNA binding protein
MLTTSPLSVKKDPVPPLVKVNSVAKLLSVSRTTVHKLIDSGDLIAKQINPTNSKDRRHLRIRRDSLIKFYKRRFGQTLDRALNPEDA